MKSQKEIEWAEYKAEMEYIDQENHLFELEMAKELGYLKDISGALKIAQDQYDEYVSKFNKFSANNTGIKCFNT